MPEQPAPTARYWVEFADPVPRSGSKPVTYRCDLTWLTSRWQCIYGAGCPGIYRERPDDGCCTLGAHYSDRDDQLRIEALAGQLGRDVWQFRDRVDPGRVGEPIPAVSMVDEEGDAKTLVVDGACVFLNRPGFAGGAGCALHKYAQASGRSLVETKPEVCWQLPIRRTFEDVTAADEVGYQVVGIGEYDRRGWGPGGHDLDWYCTTATEAHTAGSALYLRAREELVALMSPEAYDVLCRLAADFMAGRAAGTVVGAG